MLSCIYLTRKCPHKCIYCALRDSPLQRPELSTEEWKFTFDLLHDLGVEFHLILGNELLMRPDIVDIISHLNTTHVPYAFYTTCPPWLMEASAQKLVDVGLTNASSGIDIVPHRDWPHAGTYVTRKSTWGLAGLKWFGDHGVPDLHGTVTVSKMNTGRVVEVIENLTREKIWCAVNTIHWNKDGGFDFFPEKHVIEHLLLTQKDIDSDAIAIKEAHLNGLLAVQNPPKFWSAWQEHGAKLDWHCKTFQVITVDADGSLRCCGYRKGINSSCMSIFDLKTPLGMEQYYDAWVKDQHECPGCFWSYPWQAEFLQPHDNNFGTQVFTQHASEQYTIKEKE